MIGPAETSRSAVRAGLTLAVSLSAVAVAVWLLPASLHIVAWPRSGPHLIAVFAPLYRLWLLAGTALAGSVIVFTVADRAAASRLSTALAPLAILWIWTLPYWPWIAARLPLLIALAGPVRWLFAALAVAGVVIRVVSPRPQPALPGRRTAFVVALALYLVLGLRSFAEIGLGGDEPHYLIITHSLLVDHDLKIENNHAAGDYRAFFGGELRPDYLQRGLDAEIYSIHAPGLSALLLPGYAVAGARGAVVTVCLLAALAALAIFDVAVLVSTPFVAWLTWFAVCLSVPFIPHAWALYPEMAGAAIVAWAVRWSLEDRSPTALGAVWRGVCLAWLPWLHTKFIVFLAGAAVVLLWRLRHRWRLGLALIAPIALSVSAWLMFFRRLYGTFDPQAPYGSYAETFVRFDNIPRSLLGLFFDQKFGFLVYAPVYALIVPGLWVLLRDRRWRAATLASVALAGAYTLSSARLYMWWGGSSAPARFLVPVVPLLVPAMAVGITRIHGALSRTTWMVLGAGSVLVALGAAVDPSQLFLFSAPHGVARLLEVVQGSAPLGDALPTFTQEDWTSPALRLLPWLAAFALALGAGALCARLGCGVAWIGASELTTFFVAAAVFLSSFPAPARADAQARGDMALLGHFDPVRARAFDYTRLARLSPPEWLRALTVTFDREPGTPADEAGRLTGPLTVPPGHYEARVWFEGERSQPGALQADVGNGYVLARIDGPLANPAVLTVDIPVAVPALWVQLTDQTAARAVRRLEIVPRAVDAEGDRVDPLPRTVEAFDAPRGAYLAYLGDTTYPEHGVFWTRANETGRLRLVPAGATTLSATVHVGPVPTTVTLRVGEETQTMTLAPEETRTLRIGLPRGQTVVPVEVAAASWFRPVDVDPQSTDERQLGCQVRLVLE